MSWTPATGLVSVVVVTYEWPEALDLTLRALADQDDPAFEVVVADDGSGPDTAAVVERWQQTFGDRLRHVWQPDEGWRQGRNRNLGALEARGDYLVFLDGDCLVRSGLPAGRAPGRPARLVPRVEAAPPERAPLAGGAGDRQARLALVDAALAACDAPRARLVASRGRPAGRARPRS